MISIFISLVHDIHVVGSTFHHLITTDSLRISEMNFLQGETATTLFPCTESCTQPPHGFIDKICMRHMPPTNQEYPLETS